MGNFTNIVRTFPIIITGMFAGQSQMFDALAKALGYESTHHYAVIVDAGSSGSRVLAYNFRVPFTVFGTMNLELVEEQFGQSKPGLSSFADDPEKGAQTIIELLRATDTVTPPARRGSTPVIVRATAGLRLLPREKADRLIFEVRKALTKVDYLVAEDAVQIMEGSDEGIFIWYTVNLLHNLMDDKTMAALDLGGGSTQITYQLDAESARAAFPAADLHTVPMASRNITLYTHSYLNLGLLAARYGILRLEAQDNSTDRFTSVCVDPLVQNEEWTYANRRYYVSGAGRAGLKGEAVVGRCAGLVARYVEGARGWRPREPPRGTVAAMSYFYDVAADVGLIDLQAGGTVSAAGYGAAAARQCADRNVDMPWACLDLLYCAALLQQGYSIPPKAPIKLFKKVDGHEVSWALGLAYTTMMNILAEKAKTAA